MNLWRQWKTAKRLGTCHAQWRTGWIPGCWCGPLQVTPVSRTQGSNSEDRRFILSLCFSNQISFFKKRKKWSYVLESWIQTSSYLFTVYLFSFKIGYWTRLPPKWFVGIKTSRPNLRNTEFKCLFFFNFFFNWKKKNRYLHTLIWNVIAPCSILTVEQNVLSTNSLESLSCDKLK